MTNLVARKLKAMKVNFCMVLKSGKVLYHRFDQEEIAKVNPADVLENNVAEFRAHQMAASMTR